MLDIINKVLQTVFFITSIAWVAKQWIDTSKKDKDNE